VLLALAYSGWAVRGYMADRSAALVTRDSLTRAIRLDPGNATYRFALGRYIEAQQDLPGAIAQYRSALDLNRNPARYWLALATAYMQAGDANGFNSALAEAGKVAPNDLEVAWETGNWLLIEGDQDGAFRAFRNVVEADPNARRTVLDVCWRATRDAREILRVLPAAPAPLMDFLQWSVERDRPEAAAVAWDALRGLKQDFDPLPALSLVSSWLAHGRVQEAQTIWDQIAVLAPQLKSYRAGTNLVVNGGFDQDLLNAGFDWHIISATPAIGISIDRTEFHDGDSSLLLTFDGTTPEAVGVSQVVPLKPATTYEMSLFMRSRDLASNSGLRLLVADFKTQKALFLSDDALGSTGWHELKGSFTTAADAQAVELRLVRTPADRPIQGSVWIDQVSVIPR
jgi:tetratricopeptide (TPR) repeat protein